MVNKFFKLGLITLVIAAAWVVFGVGSSVSAISSVGPGWRAQDGYGGSQPRFAVERTPQNTITSISIPIYVPNRPTGNVRVNVVDFRYPWSPQFSKNNMIGVRFNGGPVTKGNHGFNVPASSFSRDANTGYWRTVISVRGEGGTMHYSNVAQFRLRVNSPSGALVGIAGGERYSTFSGYYYTTNQNRVFDYEIPFATPCNISSNTRGQIVLRDLDSGHVDNLYHNIAVGVRDETAGRTVPITTSGSRGDGGTYRINMTFEPGHRYRLVVRNVHANNSLDYTFPYDNVNYVVDCSWSISQDAAYIQRLDASGNPTGPRLGTTVNAAPGERYGFYHSWRNNGPSPTNRTVNIQRTYTYPTSSSGWANFDSAASGRPAGSLIYDRRGGHTSTIPQSAVGSSYCLQTGVTPRSSTSTTRLNGTRLCVNVPYNYTLTPRVSELSGVVEPGSEVLVRPIVNNSGPTVSRDTNWQLTRVVFSSGQTVVSGGSSSSAPCVHFGASSTCDQVENGSNVVFNPGDRALPPAGHSATIDDVAVGSRVCYVMSVQPRTHNSSNWQHSNPECMVVGKRPKVQVWGGDVASRGRVNTSTTVKSGTTYGSWSEYSALAQGVLTGLSSGAGLSDPDSPSSNLNLLTFTNNSSTLGNFTSSTYWSRPLTMTSDRFSSAGGSSGLPGGSMSSWSSGTYRVGNVSLPGGTITSGRSIIIVSSGTVTINDNISYTPGSLGSIDEIPQVVIVANNINIRGDVDQVDAWLLAPNGAINTCSDRAVTAALTAEMCDRQLTINGPVVADTLHLRRTAGSGTGDQSGDPAEIINLRADAYIWAYLQAGGSGRAQTVLTTEKAPRF